MLRKCINFIAVNSTIHIKWTLQYWLGTIWNTYCNCTFNLHWHELWKQEQCSSFAPPVGIFYKTQVCQLCHGVSRLLGPKKQGFFLKNQLYSNKIAVFCKLTKRQDLKKCQHCTFKVNLLCQKSTEFFQKKNSSKNINLGDHCFLDSIFNNFTF
jgi:hypothetical protein